MTRVNNTTFAMTALVLLCVTIPTADAAVRGHYLEARTCQVYTGPCFANGEVGLSGKNAVMAWGIAEGNHADVDLAGLNVIVVVRASQTLGFQGFGNADQLESMIVVDSRASGAQRDALVSFAKQQAGKAGQHVKRIVDAPIRMNLDLLHLNGTLEAGKYVELKTRKARAEDCICSNESAYYPPLAQLDQSVAGVASHGKVLGRALGSKWALEQDRSAYMGLFHSQGN